MKQSNYTIITALLGIVLGVLATVLVTRVYEVKKKFDGDYNRWRKLNLILQEVQKNYVDTIDMEGMTDAAVVAALAELDPHSSAAPNMPTSPPKIVQGLENPYCQLAGLSLI